jgi:hypothetical protein
MANPLNLYATKVFAEQPLALWALDDKADYISLVPSDGQDFSNWSSSGATVVDASGSSFNANAPRPPFQNEFLNGVIGDDDNEGFVRLVSDFEINESDVNASLGSVAIGLYAYTFSRVVNLRLGFVYTSTVDDEVYEVIKSANTSTTLAWTFISETFKLPLNFSNLRIVVEAYYPSDGGEFEFVLNGLSFGQWAEEFQTRSLGVNLSQIPSTIAISSEAVPGLAYGLNGESGYLLSSENSLKARSTGMPMVYGSASSVILSPNLNNTPSMIVPGFGFMNAAGSSSFLTYEFWAKIQSNATVPRKIFGPISGANGIYVDGPFLKLKVGDYLGRHYVGEWDRPMLFDVRISPTAASLVLNGEEVITLTIEEDFTNYPSKRNSQNKDQDFMGFYAYEDVPHIQIDCVGVYPYEVPAILCKRRWVYGQGVDFPSDLIGSDSSKSVFIDYPFAKYDKNYYYPQVGRWDAGIVENLSPTFNSLNMPEHTLPTVKFDNGKTQDEWYEDLRAVQNLEEPFITMKPNETWDNVDGYISFNNLKFLKEDLKAFYALFSSTLESSERQILFEIRNEISDDSLIIALEGSAIEYIYRRKQANGQYREENVYTALGHKIGDKFTVGIHMDKFSKFVGKSMASFLGTRQKLSLYVGGSRDFGQTFLGKIYAVGFCNPRNLSKIEHLFADTGVPIDYQNVFDNYEKGVTFDAGSRYFGNNPGFWDLTLDGGDPYDFIAIRAEEHIASYTLIPKIEFNNFLLDIAVDSYWEDYVPLSYLSKNVVDAFGKTKKSVGFIQLNIDYPKINNLVDGVYDTSGTFVKTYVSFQYLRSGSNATRNSFNKTEPLPASNVVRPGSDWLTTRYEVLSGSVIYPPTNVSIKNLSMNIHLEISVDGIISNPIKIRSLQVSSKSFNYDANRIGTRFGADIIPFKRSGQYFTYNNVAPFSIYKGSSPYLYLTSTSGMKMLGEYSTSNKFGLSMAINRGRSEFFKVGSMQMNLRFDQNEFPTVPTPIFELDHVGGKIEFYMIADSFNKKRGQVYALDSRTGRLRSGIMFFVNGVPVKRPILEANTWMTLGLSFTPALDFGNYLGALRVTSPIMFNNISYYQTTVAEDAERFGFRQWFAVRSFAGQDLDWGYWAGKEEVGDTIVSIPNAGFVWEEVLFLSAAQREDLDAEDVYKTYAGISRFIVESGKTLSLENYQYTAYKDVRWSRNQVVSV